MNTRTYFFNVEDLDNPFLANTYTATTAAIDHNLYIKDGIAYQSNYRAGLRMLDVNNPLNPEEVGFFDLYPSSDAASFNGTWSNYPYFESGVVAVSHIEEGLFLLFPDVPEPCTVSCGCTDAGKYEQAPPAKMEVAILAVMAAPMRRRATSMQRPPLTWFVRSARPNLRV